MDRNQAASAMEVSAWIWEALNYRAGIAGPRGRRAPH
jgi:hypothetical protein